MKFTLLMLLCCGYSVAQTGHWEGAIKLPDRDMLISIDIDHQKDWAGSFAVPGQNAPPLPLVDFAVQGSAVSFALAEMPGTPAFSGNLAADGKSISGVFKQGGGTFQFQLTRTGDPAIASFAKSTLLTDKLTGDWSGTLNMGQSLKLVLHLKNVEGVGVGTLDSVDQNARGIVISSVSQEGPKVNLELRVIGGKYSGQLSEDGRRIDGEWTQSGATAKLSFEKVVPAAK